jgi:hypothetical protein
MRVSGILYELQSGKPQTSTYELVLPEKLIGRRTQRGRDEHARTRTFYEFLFFLNCARTIACRAPTTMGWLSALAVATGWKKEPLAVAVVPRNPGTVSTKSRKSRRAAATWHTSHQQRPGEEEQGAEGPSTAQASAAEPLHCAGRHRSELRGERDRRQVRRQDRLAERRRLERRTGACPTHL